MAKGLARLAPESLGTLNREPLCNLREIRAMVSRLRDERIVLRSGINERNLPRTAKVESITRAAILLQLDNFESIDTPQIFFNFSLNIHEYFFAGNPIERGPGRRLAIEMPSAIYRAERRDLYREFPKSHASSSIDIEILRPDCGNVSARLVDKSMHGMGVQVRAQDACCLPERFEIRYASGELRGERLFAQVRHRSSSSKARGWIRLGLAVSHVAPGPLIEVERRDRIFERSLLQEARKQRRETLDSIDRVSECLIDDRRNEFSARVPVCEFVNQKGQRIKAIVDSWGNQSDATAVVIPPSWGRTKETLLPLAATILETFQKAALPVQVMRFDGTNRRGESHIDVECCQPGDEYLHFTFSQAVNDIEAAVDFLHSDEKRKPAHTILVTFSLASVEGRRAVSRNKNGRLTGWISIVGMADLQSALRTISGGIDYGYGLTRNVHFGLQELLGVIADMDQTGSDAIANNMGFLEQARADMAAIGIPVTWIHGRHDAWMDIERIREIMSCGKIDNRKIIEVPTGHQLRQSREALQAFRLIAEEISQMALGKTLPAKLPSLKLLEARAVAERSRLPVRKVDIRAFWKDYLLGRDRLLGMELLAATSTYRNFMRLQVAGLRIPPGGRIADLGCGTGGFLTELLEEKTAYASTRIHGFDYVIEALQRMRRRTESRKAPGGIVAFPIVADLDVGGNLSFAVANESYDGALASLLISYISDPEDLLRELFRILKPGGRLVVSALKKDADISKIYADAMAEMRSPKDQRKLGKAAARKFETLARSFLNDASRLLEFEEEGRFRFWNSGEFEELITKAGFLDPEIFLALGEPPQALVISAQRP